MTVKKTTSKKSTVKTKTVPTTYADNAKIKRGKHTDQATGVHYWMVELLPPKNPVTIKAFLSTCSKKLEQKNASDPEKLRGYLRFQVRNHWVELV